MGSLIAILTSASALVPVLKEITGYIETSIAGNPVTAAQGNAVFAALATAAAELPILAPIAPIVTKQFNGEEITDTDLATLQTVADGLDAAIEAKVAGIEQPAPQDDPSQVPAAPAPGGNANE